MAVNSLIREESTEKENINIQDNLRSYIKEIYKYRNLSAEEEQEAAKLASEGVVEAREILIRANLKLVICIARKVIHESKLPMVDLIQEGNIGLMVAVDKFNWKYGYRFATYAAWWIKQAMFKAISEQSHSVRIPVYIQETLSKYSKVKAALEKDSNGIVSIEDVAKRMNMKPEKINNYLNANKKTLSLEGDYEMQNGSEIKLIDIIEDKRNSVSRDIERESLKREVVDLLNGLKIREQRVIALRFGLEGEGKQTLEEIGHIYGVTKECIRQTERRALEKLRKNRKSYNLYEDYIK